MENAVPAAIEPTQSRTLWFFGIAIGMLFVDQMVKESLDTGFTRPLFDLDLGDTEIYVRTAGVFNRWFILGIGKGWLDPGLITLVVTVLAGGYWVSLIEELLKPSVGWVRGFVYASAAGGIMGNLLDRWVLGGVRDVIGVTVWNTIGVVIFLNPADIAIIAGVVYGILAERKRSARPLPAPPTPVPEVR